MLTNEAGDVTRCWSGNAEAIIHAADGQVPC